MPLGILIGLLIAHFVGDFLLQSDRMAVGKGKSWLTLAEHVFLYSLCFRWVGGNFTVITAVAHYITDAITSRITGSLWFLDMLSKPEDTKDGRFVGRFNGKRHLFFVAIGADQLIHYVTLIVTWHLLKG